MTNKCANAVETDSQEKRISYYFYLKAMAAAAAAAFVTGGMVLAAILKTTVVVTVPTMVTATAATGGSILPFLAIGILAVSAIAGLSLLAAGILFSRNPTNDDRCYARPIRVVNNPWWAWGPSLYNRPVYPQEQTVHHHPFFRNNTHNHPTHNHRHSNSYTHTTTPTANTYGA